MDYTVLVPEVRDDPLGRGYAGMTDAEVVADMNTAYRQSVADTLTASQVYEATVVSEFQALSDALKVYVRDILGLGGDIAVGPSSKARAVLIGAFGVGSTTITALAAALVTSITRAAELELGSVSSGHIKSAREQIGA